MHMADALLSPTLAEPCGQELWEQLSIVQEIERENGRADDPLMGVLVPLSSRTDD